MKKVSTKALGFLLFGIILAAGWLQVHGATGEAAGTSRVITLWEPLVSDRYNAYEKIALLLNVFIALAGLLYALLLMKQVREADQGSPKMQEIAQAVREGANAYLYRQFRVVGLLIAVITVLLFIAARLAGAPIEIAWGRSLAFLVGSTFSALVGFVGMRLATIGNLRVAAAAPVGFGRALQLGYRTGTITGMLTDGLGLLGGSIIFLIFGEHAYEALLGFGFGGTLLALFMRVGGGIYTKAADVGADLVGKLEKGIPEDDPRNAATIADNVGDNVGDCAGMAADIFESYEVTIVAAMILGLATFGHKGVIFPLLVRAIGVVASIISTYSVRAGDKGTVDDAMSSVNRGFVIGSLISVLGFVVLGFFYLRFDASYFQHYPQALLGYPLSGGTANLSALPFWANLGIGNLDMRPAWTCLVGIILA
ncbi:MAG: sodium/proton-translocating pyrophosphatase, partial [Elusimicrobia bacterium]|nr:sodium/proton-translocating pyrophosphatase [Elusimicrobiota bacterium]